MDEAVAGLAGAWLTKALHDLQTARIVGNAPEGPLDTAIYHCQQAAEKAMKAWLTANNVAFEKSHDIGRLVRQAIALHPEFRQFTASAQLLTPYVTAFRYPVVSEPMGPTREEFDEALKAAEAIYEFVLGLLPAEVRPKAGPGLA